MINWETLITFTYPHEAHMAKLLLESEGIQTMIQDEKTIQVKNFLSNALGGVKLSVQNEDYVQGIAILKKGGYIREEDYKPEEVRFVYVDKSHDDTFCPFCKSDNIAKNKGINLFTVIFYFLIGVMIPIFKIKYKCYDCEKEWKYRKAKG
jgi:hypothetical protein